MPNQIPQMPVTVPAAGRPRPICKISQESLRFYWELRRLVDGFEHRIMTAESIAVESGELSVPALRRTS